MKKNHDTEWMQQALHLAERGCYTTKPNPRVGCVIVKKDLVIGEGYHVRAGEPHAERIALADAGSNAQGATAYVTLEPCAHTGRTPPCTEALIQAGIQRVVAAMKDPFPQVNGQGLRQLQEAGIAIEVGCLEERARALNEHYLHRIEKKRPWTQLKLAMSMDGRTAMASGESQWITGTDARADVQHWRALSSAILTTARTVLLDNPRLNVRSIPTPFPFTEKDQPWRIIIDRKGIISAKARLFQSPGRIIIVTTKTAAQEPNLSSLEKKGAELWCIPQADNPTHIDISALYTRLAQEGCNALFTEVGATFAGTLLSGQWVDEILLYIAPSFLGHNAKPLLDLPNIHCLHDRLNYSIHEIHTVGQDLRLRLRRKPILPSNNM